MTQLYKSLHIACLVTGLAGQVFAGGPVPIIWDNIEGANAAPFYSDISGAIPLSAGSGAVSGDGFLIQLVALQGGTNYLLTSGTIGDTPAATSGINGFFDLSSSISSNTLAGAFGSPLGVVFYNSSVLGSATAYGIISNVGITVPSPNWVTPPTATRFDIDVQLAAFQGPRTSGGSELFGQGFYTDTLIVIPEPSSLLLVGMGVAGAWFIRRRKKS